MSEPPTDRTIPRPRQPLPALLLAVAAAGLIFLSFGQAWWNPIQDPDLFWQLWAGEQMLSGHFPDANSFSWTAPETPWTPHAPLVALSYAAVGLDCAGLLRGLVVSITALLLAALAWRKDNAWATLFALCWCIILVIYGRSERALTWGNLLLAVIALLLYRVDEKQRWRLPVAAALVAVWANVHGSFVIGILMVGLVRWYWGLAAAALCLCNPSGPWLYALLFGYGMGNDAEAFVHQAIPEWYPLDLTTMLGWLRLACLLGGGYLLIRDKKWRAVALWACVGALGVRHQRFFDVLGIALLPIIADALARCLPARAIRHPAPLLAGAMLLAALVSPRPRVDTSMYPTPLLEHIPREARLWNEFHLGGWLGYHGQRCFWDPRNDCYPLAVLEDGLRIEKRRAGWLDTLERWQVDAVLTSDGEMVAALVDRGWRRRASHEAFVFLQRPAATSSPRPSTAPPR